MTQQEFEQFFDHVDPGMVYDRKGRPIPQGRAVYLKYQRSDYHRVGSTTLYAGAGQRVWVSTVWLVQPVFALELRRYRLGLEPFETMIFTELEHLNERLWRWPTLRAAQVGHRQVVRALRSELVPPLALVKRRHGWRPAR